MFKIKSFGNNPTSYLSFSSKFVNFRSQFLSDLLTCDFAFFSFATLTFVVFD